MDVGSEVDIGNNTSMTENEIICDDTLICNLVKDFWKSRCTLNSFKGDCWYFPGSPLGLSAKGKKRLIGSLYKTDQTGSNFVLYWAWNMQQ